MNAMLCYCHALTLGVMRWNVTAIFRQKLGGLLLVIGKCAAQAAIRKGR
jgi:hypothetical protein